MRIYTQAIFACARPKFLILAPICILLGIAASLYNGFKFEWVKATACLLTAFFAHVAVNLLNEYQDHMSDLDHHTDKTPFSGGSGTLQSYPNAAKQVYVVGIISLMVSVLFGILLAIHSSLYLLAAGVLGIAIVGLYTPYINRSALICLLSPGLGFGLIMINGTYIALTETLSWHIFMLSLIVFFLVNNLLLLNQIPDAHVDEIAGRKHLVIKWGYKASAGVYALFACAASASILFLIMSGWLPQLALAVAVVILLISLKIAQSAAKYQRDNLSSFKQFLGLNVAITLLSPLIIAVILIFAAQ